MFDAAFLTGILVALIYFSVDAKRSPFLTVRIAPRHIRLAAAPPTRWCCLRWATSFHGFSRSRPPYARYG